MELTHASFFSGAGGTDIGLERAGWHTVSFAEIDPYASAVLAERWPSVPNLGDIVQLARRDGNDRRAEADDARARPQPLDAPSRAALWSGGFPCQDLETGPGSADGSRIGLDIAGGLTRRYGKGVNSTVDDGGIVVASIQASDAVDGSAPDASGVREADGLAGRSHDQRGVAGAELAPTLNANKSGGWRYDADQAESLQPGSIASQGDDALLPLGLDSSRYRCCGNGVVAPVAEWLGLRLARWAESA
jgi:site-specific DNA-cytosine methylase